LIHFTNRHLWKDVTCHSCLLVKISTVSTVSINLDNLDKNLDTAKSGLKNLDFKNLDHEKKLSFLDSKDNLDRFQKLISTDREISISIGLDC
jgi:hypothetical protein